jgi:hypothetical protein
MADGSVIEHQTVAPACNHPRVLLGAHHEARLGHPPERGIRYGNA